jgi:putative transposase
MAGPFAMRIPRKLILHQPGGLVHKFWRAHNREFLLRDPEVKALYLSSMKRALEHRSVNGAVKLHSFCMMSNHDHTLVHYQSTSDDLSTFMRVGHSIFGQAYNRTHDRQGPVAYERPKTLLVQPDLTNEMRVHFYIESNPLRAGMLMNLKLYKFSSFAYYAWGRTSEYTTLLTVPRWYAELGATPEARQAKYRSLFDEYLREAEQHLARLRHVRFIGDPDWVSVREADFRARRTAKPEPPDLAA